MLIFFAEIFSWAALPWSKYTEEDAMRRMQQLEKLPKPELCPFPLYQCLLECWKVDVSKRANATAIRTCLFSFEVDAELEWPVLPSLEERKEAMGSSRKDVPIDEMDLESTSKFASLEVNRNDVTTQRVLGKGEFGTVLLAQLNNRGESQAVAAKVLSGEHIPAAEVKQFEYEARLLASISHPNIVTLVGVVFHSQPNMMLLEVMTNGDLRKFLQTRAARFEGEGTIDELKMCCLRICEAMEYLERRKIVHRDLAARLTLFWVFAFHSSETFLSVLRA
jgi:hypothetical protein